MKFGDKYKNNMISRGFRRLRYDEIQQLVREFSVHNIGCGYMREFYYHPFSREVRGNCYIREEMKEPCLCTKHIPFRLEDCEVYQRWLDRKQKSD
jgi:hypothetical protein